MARDLEDGLQKALKASPRLRSLDQAQCPVTFAHTISPEHRAIGLIPASSEALTRAIKGIRRVHSLRLLLTQNAAHVVFLGDFDPPTLDVLAVVLARCPTLFDAVWARCEGYPASGMERLEAFVDFLELGYEPLGFHYRAHPHATVEQICRALDWRRKTMRFQVELAKTPKHDE